MYSIAKFYCNVNYLIYTGIKIFKYNEKFEENQCFERMDFLRIKYRFLPRIKQVVHSLLPLLVTSCELRLKKKKNLFV